MAWYDISGTANLYEQLPYLVSAGFSGLALIMVGSALLVAARTDRMERRLAQLIEALTEVRAASGPVDQGFAAHPPGPAEEGAADPIATAAGSFLVADGGTTYHRPECLLLRDKATGPATPSQVASGQLTPCPVCDPDRSTGPA